MKKEKTSLPVYILLVLLCLAMNWAGDRLTGKMNLPFWFDSVGTVLIAYLAGPWCGAVVGACSGLLMHVIYGVNWIYSVIGIVIGARIISTTVVNLMPFRIARLFSFFSAFVIIFLPFPE